MLWEYLTYRRAAEAEQKASEARYDVRELNSDLHHARDDLQRVLLVTRAMWELLREKAGLTDEDLMQKVTELDLADGTRDGRLATGVRSCASCGRTLGRRQGHCLYCGAHDASRGPFEGRG